MKKILLISSIILAAGLIIVLWNVFGPTVNAPEGKYFYVRTGATFPEVKAALLEKKIISNGFFFDLVSKQVNYDERIQAGKFEINNKSSVVSLVRMLRSGRQIPVRLVINKLRTKEDFASKIGREFEIDSSRVIRFISNNDSLAPYHLDTNTVMTTVIPNSYLFWWNVSFKKLFERFVDQGDKFWNTKRKHKADSLGLTPVQVYTMASIVEEETNILADKRLIASVYINRIKKGMRLEADPTVKYAMRDFGLKRILKGHLLYTSEYNTYQNAGLPPGPICTPSINTIDAVLNAERTNYIFFVARPDFSGYSNFAADYASHLQNARLYQKALDSLTLARKNIN